MSTKRTSAVLAEILDDNGEIYEGNCPEKLVKLSRKLETELAAMRQALSQVATNLGNGSVVSPDAGVEFMTKDLPKEVGLYCEKLRRELEAMTISRDEARRFAESYKALLWESETQLAAMTGKLSEMELYKKAYQETARKCDAACSELSAVNKSLKAEREKCAKLREAADTGLGYAQECLVSHDVELGRTIERNKRCAESIEADIATIKKALEATK